MAFLFIVLISYSLPALSAELLPNSISGISCKNQIINHLKKEGIQFDWRKTLPPRGSGVSYKSPTKEIGKWVVLTPQKSGNSEIQTSHEGVATTVTFDKKCKLTTEKGTSQFSKAKPTGKRFTDSDLKKLVEMRKKAAILVWSPGMTFSTGKISVVEKIASRFGYHFVALLDSSAPNEDAKKTIATKGISFEKISRRVASSELAFRDVSVHQPAVLFIEDGKISSRTYTGAREEKEWKRIFMQRRVGVR